MNEQAPEFGIQMGHDVGSRSDIWNKLFVLASAVAIARVGGMINPDLSIRDYLPEPFDVPDHIGNLGGLMLVGYPFMKGYANGTAGQATTREVFEKGKRSTARVIGAVTVAANAVGELVGYGSISTPDPVDFAYGLGGGYLLYRILKPEFLPESEVDEVLEVAQERSNGGHELTEDETEVVTRFMTHKQKIIALKAKFAEARQRRQTKPTPQLMPSNIHNQAAKKTPKKGGNKSVHQGRYTPPKKKR